jgi:hypothetical protein
VFARADYQLAPPDGGELHLSDHHAEPKRTWSEVVDDLLAIRNLDDDWDGQGAEVPRPELVDWAISLALAMRDAGIRPADFAIAGVNGTVFFEWHSPADFQEIEVTAPYEAEVRRVRKGSDVTEVYTLPRRS